MTVEMKKPDDSDRLRKADIEISYIKSAVKDLQDSYEDLRETVVQNQGKMIDAVNDIKLAIAEHNAVHAASDARIGILESCMAENKETRKTVKNSLATAIISAIVSALAVAFGLSKP